jgi:hypothetical protein
LHQEGLCHEDAVQVIQTLEQFVREERFGGFRDFAAEQGRAAPMNFRVDEVRVFLQARTLPGTIGWGQCMTGYEVGEVL